ncbi:MAG TPA: nucleoside-diphosphate sugar epimerase/dehydratase [bacterium]|nr:nucleoside-diphosphate sugar epimerase/dehydratase [bacterium]HPN45596.1 nucleoside-diphosphate sugar epimerase/dehydratase [bacterium]
MFSTIFKNRKVQIDLVIHLILFFLSYLTAFVLAYNGKMTTNVWYIFNITVPIVILARLILFIVFQVINGQWADASISDAVQIVKASFVSSLLITFMMYLFHDIESIPISALVIDLFMVITFTGCARFSVRLINEIFMKKSDKVKRVLIVGTGIIGRRLIKEMKTNWEMGYSPVALVDDNPAKLNTTIMGVKVVGTRKSIPHIVDTMNIDEIIIAFAYAKGEDMREIVNFCRLSNRPFKIISKHEVPVDQKTIVDRIRQINIEDLIGREQIKIDFDQIQKYIEGKRVLITGAAGSIGSELCRQVAKFRPEQLICFDRSENGLFYLERELQEKFQELNYSLALADITDFIETDNVFNKHKPQIVFHAAAYKHVPMMELHPSQAVKNNVMGTKNVLDVSIQHGVKKFVFISTDKAVNPVSFMGMTKRIAEQLVQASDNSSKTRCLAVRFGNVIGSSGSVIRLFQEQISKGGPVTVTHPDVKRYFMSIPEAVLLVLQAAVLGEGGQTFLLKMGDLIKINDLAKELIMMSGNGSQDKIKISYTGLRFGEKILEELWEESEELVQNVNENLYVLKGRSINKFNLREFKGKINNIIRVASAQEKNLNGFKSKLEEIIQEGRAIM